MTAAKPAVAQPITRTSILGAATTFFSATMRMVLIRCARS